MQIEHPLTAEQAAYTKAAIEVLNKQRQAYLLALGQAKEAEMVSQGIRESLSQMLGLVEREAKLPPPVRPYLLSADGTKLVGEIFVPERLEQEFLEKHPALRQVNGHAAEGMADA
jgi:hypothetical protein